jgi:micrococcal nuclease
MFSRFFDTVLCFLLVSLFLNLFLIIGSSGFLAAQSFEGIGKKIIDGDSFILMSGGKDIEVRLYGIDCPEYLQPFGQAAKQFTKEFLFKKNITIIPYYYDSYNRLVCIVHFGEKSLNNELVNAGLAWVYPKYCKKKICNDWNESEDIARKYKRVLWRGANPISTWMWKRKKWINHTT